MMPVKGQYKCFPASSNLKIHERLEGQRVSPGDETDRTRATALARTKTWWQRIRDKRPIFSRGRWWWVIGPEAVSP